MPRRKTSILSSFLSMCSSTHCHVWDSDNCTAGLREVRCAGLCAFWFCVLFQPFSFLSSAYSCLHISFLPSPYASSSFNSLSQTVPSLQSPDQQSSRLQVANWKHELPICAKKWNCWQLPVVINRNNQRGRMGILIPGWRWDLFGGFGYQVIIIFNIYWIKWISSQKHFPQVLPYLIDLTMQPLQKRCPHGVCTASRRAIRQIGHSYLLSKGGSNSTSYPCVSSVNELGGFPVPLLTLTLSSFAPTLQALAMAAQQPLSRSRAPQLLLLCSKLIVADQGPHGNALQDDRKMC